MARSIDTGTLLGKCVIDGNPIYEGAGMRSRHAVVLNGKWISGDIILKIYPTAFQAFLDENRDKEKEKEILMERYRKAAKALNRPIKWVMKRRT